MSEKIWHLKRCNLFEHLAPDELRVVEGRSRARKFPRGNPIYLPVDQADGVLLVASGRAKICNFTAEGKQAILSFVEPGEIFGELALFGDQQREEYAEAVDPSLILLIPNDEMLRLIEAHPSVSLGVTKLMGLRRRRVERRLKYLLFRSNRERLVHLLLELAEQYGQRRPEGVLLTIKLSHQDLANVIGSTRETVTVVLGDLQSEGLLELGRRKIVLRDIGSLADSVQAKPPEIMA
jgi:CRP-like cAMP-binding protein